MLSTRLAAVVAAFSLVTASAFAPARALLHCHCGALTTAPAPLLKRPASLAPRAMVFDNSDVATAFSVATFYPQPFWMLMILLPNAGITKAIMRPWPVLLADFFVHLFIVVVSAGQNGGTAPIAEFTGVFDPAGDPQKAMIGMMTYPNFVSEEWSHVLAWDFFVGRWIWLDGLRRGVFTPHSVLLCNLIGPPGLLLHFLTCAVTGKGLPGDGLPDDDEQPQRS